MPQSRKRTDARYRDESLLGLTRQQSSLSPSAVLSAEGSRERNRESSTFTFTGACGGNGTTLHIHQVTHNRESKIQSAESASCRTARLCEQREYSGQDVSRDPSPRVLDLNKDLLVRWLA